MTPSIPSPGNPLVCAQVPEAMDGLVLAQFLQTYPKQNFLHIVRNESRMVQIQDFLAFTGVPHEVMAFPAWDCLPYDRVSPQTEVMAQRMKVLGQLSHSKKPQCILATSRAVLQKVPPHQAMTSKQQIYRAGESLDITAFQGFLAKNGYTRVTTVREPGEYALRGSLIDLYPAGEATPLRLDLFGDVIESIKEFDPLTQRSQKPSPSFSLDVVGELTLSDKRIEQFRSQYRQQFGANAVEDPLYQNISEGRSYIGMEHWLPLFYDRLETLFDYLPKDHLTVLLEHQIDHTFVHHVEQIEDYFQARVEALALQHSSQTSKAYRPVPVEQMFLNLNEIQNNLQRCSLVKFSAFLGQENGRAVLDWQGKRVALGEQVSSDGARFETFRRHLPDWVKQKTPVLFATYSQASQNRLLELLKAHEIGPVTKVQAWDQLAALPPSTLGVTQLQLEQGFVSEQLVLVTEQDLLGQRQIRPTHPKRDSELFIRDLSAVSENDLVVHNDHGVGKYLGLTLIEADGLPHDCLSVEYSGGDKLFVPVENIEILSLYGSEGSLVQLDRLGSAAWQARKARVKERLKIIADQLLAIAAERATKTGEVFQAQEATYQEFSAQFPYLETDDQMQAIDVTLQDLRSGQPMDRLVCGDVGFGKTEVALRAAYTVASSGYQVAIVVPTTLLARQHFHNFSERFRGFNLKVAQLSRMVSAADKTKTKQEMAAGKVDIIIGTHALLAKSVSFHQLGLVIVDEEQHFGVKQKERLKELKSDVHVLTLTATPIPRTLQMALTGVRDMSLITTPPVDRLAVRSFVMPFDGVVIREAIMRERDRGGQVFYVCPRLEDLPKIFDELTKLLPEITIATAHGQMPSTQLEQVMLGFDGGQYDVLLSTNIIESGLDVPNANTIIIHRSDRFGLAQLYQLRGRVGRSKQRGYAYFLLPHYHMSDKAVKRLEVMQTLDSLGAGFQLASHDMDIRGAGNLLGSEQSGHVREVGVELYQQMLEEAVETARFQKQVRDGKAETPPEESWTPQINVGLAVLIPDYYVEDLSERLALYRRLSLLTTSEE